MKAKRASVSPPRRSPLGATAAKARVEQRAGTAAPARPRGRRSREEAARTRQRILDRAEKLFAKKGYRAVSTRELAQACGVHPYTIQHHFGSKPKLYEAVLCRWDEPIRAMTRRHATAAESRGTSAATPVSAEMIDELLDFLLAKRDWITLNMRSRLGEGLPRGVTSADPGWLRFLSDTRPAGGRRGASMDVANSLLLITIEGILHQHVTSQQRYRELLGRDLGDGDLRRQVKRHLVAVIEAIVGHA